MRYFIGILIQMLMMLAVAPMVNGIIKKIKALSQKRQGAPIYQLYSDLFKLITKDMVISTEASWVFKITPFIVFACSIVAAVFVPISTQYVSLDFAGDIIVVISILALGRFFMVLAGLDTASTFGGMGSSREIMVSCLFEPVMLISVFTLGLLANTTSVSGIMQHSVSIGSGIIQPVYILIFIALFIVLIAETARIPLDDPSTHLELTMIHEAMVLEYSGKYLALMEFGASIKQLILITLIANVFIPTGLVEVSIGGGCALWVSLGFYILKVIAISIGVSIFEISTVKLRLFRIPELAGLAFIAAFIGFLQYFI